MTQGMPLTTPRTLLVPEWQPVRLNTVKRHNVDSRMYPTLALHEARH
jgi:hypothetical protein